MEDLIERKQAFLIDKASEILNRMETLERKFADVDLFWQRDSLYHFNQTLAQIIDSKEFV